MPDGIRERSTDDEERVEVLVDPSRLALAQVSPDEWPDEDQDDDDDSEMDDDEGDERTEDDESVEDDYAGAVAIYDRALLALQRRDFVAAANALRDVIARYPDEHALLDRARLYLNVCASLMATTATKRKIENLL